MRRSSALKYCSKLSLVIFLLHSFLYNVDFTSKTITRESEVYKKPVVLPKAAKDLNKYQTTQHSETTHDAEIKHKDDSMKLNSLLPSKPNTPPTIAYAVTVTSCGADYILDGAAVLKHSIELSSYPNKNSKYSSKMIAFFHPNATSCAEIFENLGYEIQVKEVPFKVANIKGDYLRKHIDQAGCCGEKEYLKLYAYTLIDYPIVVHFDLDSLVLQPLDDLFDSMLNGDNGALPVVHNATVPKNIEAFYTVDYNMGDKGLEHPGVQGGFLVVKPSMQHFDEYIKIVLEGNFVERGGWGGQYGWYFGGAQIQGICSYFFEHLHKGANVELNRCIYNSMSDAPKREDEDAPGTYYCMDRKDDTCEDCRETDVDKIKSTHFTLCQKPWLCPSEVLEQKNCKYFHSSWFQIRKDFEEKNGMAKKVTNEDGGHVHDDVFKGFCSKNGEYQKMDI